MLIIKGGGTHQIEEKIFPVLDQQLFFLIPGQYHQFKPDSNAEFIFLAIDDEQLSPHTGLFLRDFDFFQGTTELSYIQDKSVLSILKILEEIQEELKSPQLNQEQLIISLITTALIKIQRCFFKVIPTDYAHKKSPELIQKFFKLLSNPNINARFVKEYAKHLYVHPNYLNIMINKHTHQSASSWIHQQCIINAKRALIHSNNSISKISSELGFNNATHFTRFFKHYTKETPKNFRTKT